MRAPAGCRPPALWISACTGPPRASTAAARTREGVDRGFAQNFLGAYLLTRLLEERLLASAPARVIAVGSSAHRLLKNADIDALMRPGTADLRLGTRQRGRYQMRSYQTAKLAVTTWAYSLARRWAGRGVTANLLDPGIVKGQMGEQFEGPALTGVLMSHVIPFFVAAGMQRGSQQYVRLAADPALATVSGRYYVRGKEKQQGSSPLSLDPATARSMLATLPGLCAIGVPAAGKPGTGLGSGKPRRLYPSAHGLGP